MLTEYVTDDRSWTRDFLKAPGLTRFSERCLKRLAGLGGDSSARSEAITEVVIDPLISDCHSAVTPVLSALESGPGFAVVEGVPTDQSSVHELKLIYWSVGQLFGEPFPQKVRGTLLYDVRDEGDDVASGARFSTTKAESSFHTDASFHPRLPDYVGLLCLRTAKRGGSSQLVSAYSIHNMLLATQPDLLRVLYDPFLFDRRGEHERRESATTEAPMFVWDGAELTVRYLDLYIREGHRLAGRNLTEDQRLALGAMKDLCADSSLQFEFNLEPGQMLFVNNHWILHNRTSFEDHSGPELRRHLMRLWLSRRPR